MHGLWNTFVVLRGPIELSKNQIIDLCKISFKKGADGLLVISTIDKHSFKMDYWNKDGSIAEMCGNGLRCAVKFAVDNNLVDAGKITAATGAGKLQAVWDGKSEDIEVQVGKVKLLNKKVKIAGYSFDIADVGNPHAITFVQDLNGTPVSKIGPKVEYDKTFPNRTNVEFIEVTGRKGLKMRIWERGFGETAACGTGMVAAAAQSEALGLVNYPISVDVPGGRAEIWLDDGGFSRIKALAVTIGAGSMKL